MKQTKQKMTKAQRLKNSLSSLEGSTLKSCNISFERDTKVSDQIMQTCGLLPEIESNSDASYGIGRDLFKGSEWLNGGCFLGFRSNGSGIVRFTDKVGQDLLLKLVSSSEFVEQILPNVKITRVDFYTGTVLPSVMSVASFNELCFKASALEPVSKTSPVIYQNKDTLQIGKPASSRSLKIETLDTTSSGTFNKLLLNASLTGKSARDYLLSLSTKNSSFNDCSAFSLYSIFEIIPKCQLFDVITGVLNSKYSLGRVFIPEISSKKTTVPSNLKSLKSACTLIVNRLKDIGTSKAAQEVVLRWLVLEIVKNELFIKDYPEFIINMVDSLSPQQKQTIEKEETQPT